MALNPVLRRLRGRVASREFQHWPRVGQHAFRPRYPWGTFMNHRDHVGFRVLTGLIHRFAQQQSIRLFS